MTNEPFDPKAYLQQGAWRDVRLGLHRTEELLERLGRPQDAVRIVHVAGTNGKGSTCAFIAGILQEAGYKTGLFSSPYILRFNERVQVNRADISDDDLYDVACEVRDAAESMEEHPTAFELITAVALLHFARVGCDVAVLEVGLGGRLDSTNVVNPVACAITPVSLDHTHVLGDMLEKIAVEKAGIIKPGVPVVCAAQPDEAAAVIRARAREVAAPLLVPRFGRVHAHSDGLRQVFSYDGISDVHLRLAGVYQPLNAVVAIELARVLRTRGFDISDDAIKRGLESARWPGRFEIVGTSPTVVVDGGHNEQGARALADSLRAYFPRGGVSFSMSVLRDKDYRAMLADILPLARRMFCAEQHDNERALSTQELAAAVCEVARGLGRRVVVVDGSASDGAGEGSSAPSTGDSLDGGDVLEVYRCTSVGEAARAARDAAASDGDEGVACCFGSLYAIHDIYEALGIDLG